MEHILQFGINIDDEKIKNTVMAKVDKVVHEIVKGDVIEALTGNRNNSDYTYSRSLKELVNNTMERFCEDNKQTIIDLAADRLAEKLSRTKVAKEAIEKVLKEMEIK